MFGYDLTIINDHFMTATYGFPVPVPVRLVVK